MEVRFVENNDAESSFFVSYLSSVENVTFDFSDKYPDGVLSLTLQYATFVIKLEFDDNNYKGDLLFYTASSSIASPAIKSGNGIGLHLCFCLFASAYKKNEQACRGC